MTGSGAARSMPARRAPSARVGTFCWPQTGTFTWPRTSQGSSPDKHAHKRCRQNEAGRLRSTLGSMADVPTNPTPDARGIVVARLLRGIAYTGRPERRHRQRMGNPTTSTTPRRLLLEDGFVVDGGRDRHLEERACSRGFEDLRGYLQARCDAGASIPRIAAELGVGDWQVQAALSRSGCGCRPGGSGWQRSGGGTPRNASPRVWPRWALPTCGPTLRIGWWRGRGCWRRWPRNWRRTG